MSRCPDIDEQMSQKSDEQMSDEQVLHDHSLSLLLQEERSWISFA